jgi:hypothetical protein
MPNKGQQHLNKGKSDRLNLTPNRTLLKKTLNSPATMIDFKIDMKFSTLPPTGWFALPKGNLHQALNNHSWQLIRNFLKFLAFWFTNVL